MKLVIEKTFIITMDEDESKRLTSFLQNTISITATSRFDHATAAALFQLLKQAEVKND